MEFTNILQCVDKVNQLFKDISFKELLDTKNGEVNLNSVLVAIKQTIERLDVLESAFNALETRINKLENDDKKNKKSKSKLLDVPAPFEGNNNNTTK